MIERTAIIFPCYKEEKRLDIAAFRSFLEQTENVYLIFVDDGSTDATRAVLDALVSGYEQCAEVVALPENRGKGEAVRHGLLHALALDTPPSSIGYWDADLATPLACIREFEDVLKTRPEVEIVLGARVALLGRHIERKLSRHYAGRAFATVASLILNLPVYDTQTGAKLFRVTPHTGDLFSRPFGSRWVFDVEILARYIRDGGTARGLYEHDLPSWSDVGDSKVRPSDFARSIGEMLDIYNQYDLKQPMRSVFAPLTGVFARYVGVGGFGTAIHFVTLILCVEVVGLKPGVGATVGAIAGAVINYLLNYNVTFASKIPHTSATVKFGIVALAGILASAWGVQRLTEAGVNYVFGQLICTAVVFVFGFFLNRAWTFRAST
jgi:dolichyl-phosphate beta-glucosyltransferase